MMIANPFNACAPLEMDAQQKALLIERGNCSFGTNHANPFHAAVLLDEISIEIRIGKIIFS